MSQTSPVLLFVHTMIDDPGLRSAFFADPQGTLDANGLGDVPPEDVQDLFDQLWALGDRGYDGSGINPNGMYDDPPADGGYDGSGINPNGRYDDPPATEVVEGGYPTGGITTGGSGLEQIDAEPDLFGTGDAAKEPAVTEPGPSDPFRFEERVLEEATAEPEPGGHSWEDPADRAAEDRVADHVEADPPADGGDAGSVGFETEPLDLDLVG